MSVLLVILTFVTFLAIDFVVRALRARREIPVQAKAASAPALAPAPLDLAPVWVAGYRMPEDLHYHPAHTWARLGADDAVVGLDDFAGRLIGRADGWVLPPVGSVVRQGDPAFRARLDGRSADLLSPLDGVVVATNDALASRPGLATDDPYGRGWLLKVRPADLRRDLRNLLSGTAAGRWMEGSRERLEWHLMSLSGSVLQDGGEPAADFSRRLTDDEWRRLAEEFLRT
jgi:glycine cleavage system H lipoate-binding protein